LPLWLVLHYQARQNIRRMFGMPTAYACEDVATLCCCEGCAMCQELNEVDLRAAAGMVPLQPGGVLIVNPVYYVPPPGGVAAVGLPVQPEPTILVTPAQADMAGKAV
jgi:hypothetical protein